MTLSFVLVFPFLDLHSVGAHSCLLNGMYTVYSGCCEQACWDLQRSWQREKRQSEQVVWGPGDLAIEWHLWIVQ